MQLTRTGTNQDGSSEDIIDPRKPPPCLDLLFTLFGHLAYDRGTLTATGGHAASDETPPNLGTDNSIGGSNKRQRGEEVESPMKKKTPSIEECVRDISESVKSLQQICVSATDEMFRVIQLLEEDGIQDTSPEYARATILCKNPLDRLVFLNTKTKEGRLNWINVSWEDRTSGNK
jgi:hypothetical protein